jgi:hypothetical protein
MTQLVAAIVLAIATLAPVAPVHARGFDVPPPNILPPPPPPPPPPKLDIPKIPKMGEIPGPPKAARPRRGSFSDRVTRCIEEGAAAGLGPNERAAYSRACANR